MAHSLAASVPFLASHPESSALRLGDVVFVPCADKVRDLQRLLERSLVVGRRGRTIGARAAETLVVDQYASCLEHVFSSELWHRLRAGTGQSALVAYLIETRHYLHAATSRMSGGVASMPHEREVTGRLAEHLLEEADHARFFEGALELLAIPRSVVSRLRPHPATLQWILVMRSAGFEDPLAAALSSGVMEASATDRALVGRWHDMLVDSGLLPAEVVAAIRRHVDLDAELGHGANWRHCLRAYRRIEAHRLAHALNLATIAAEATREWSDALLGSPIGRVAATVRARGEGPGGQIDASFGTDRVWSASFLGALVACDPDSGYAAAVTAAYAVPSPDGLVEAPSRLAAEAASLRDTCSRPAVPEGGRSLDDTVGAWLCAIDGHRLWGALIESQSPGLARGWIVENYHYLAASARHVSAALFACPDPAVRDVLRTHLAEEARHEDILAAALERQGVPPPGTLRPLPSTVAFIGYLRELALLDWKAYVVALAFLQRSFTPEDERHSQFYAAMARRSPELAGLACAMQEHDRVDGGLDHHAQVGGALRLLQRGHDVPADSMRRAALVPQLTWGFLDGIAQHYSRSEHAVLQRVGWRCG
jgi:pyrroloquinoline quinone (PQQ) biosynthesis protein C